MTRPKPTCKWFAVCPMKTYYERGMLDHAWLDRYCHGDWETCVRYQLEERNEPHPDWLLPDGTLAERLAPR